MKTLSGTCRKFQGLSDCSWGLFDKKKVIFFFGHPFSYDRHNIPIFQEDVRCIIYSLLYI